MNHHQTPPTPAQRGLPHAVLPVLVRVAVLAPLASSLLIFTALPAHPTPPSPGTPATATLKIAARLSLTATPKYPDPHTRVTLTAYVAQIASNRFPATGTITFFDGAARLAVRPLTLGYTSWTVVLRPGTHHLTARYPGDRYYTPARSASLRLTVTPRAAVTAKPATLSPPTLPPLSSPPRASSVRGLSIVGVLGIFAILALAAVAMIGGLLLLLLVRSGSKKVP
jgi:hypothetical protein